ncbi:hypothetical protein TWF696_000376 [Orbilia brochopaga]|uniref:C2H2-type domain-containing protein n=1 Tax=Orbilia brochopaga TaxID=3140254 RepID=A0AAV9VEN6_9PEZI
MADNWTAMHNFGRKQQRSLSQGHPHHHRVQSTNMLFPSNVDPMAQLSRNGIRVAPTEARAAALAASSPFNLNVPWTQQQLMQMKAQQQHQMQRMIQAGQQVQMDVDASTNGNMNNTDNINRISNARRASSSAVPQQLPVMHTPEEFQRARLNARGLHAGVNLLPMFGDKPPQSSRSGSPRLGSGYGSDTSSGMTPPSHYNLGFGFAETTHYSYKPDTARLRVDEDVDDSMDEWEKELFQSYRKMKYYGEEQQSKERTVEIVTKFTAAARGAWSKLEQAAQSDEVSDGFRKFFAAVGSYENLTRQGFRNLDLMLDGKPPTTLIPVYSLLHVAYAISQTASDKVPQLPKPLSVAEFSMDAQTTWKQCLKTGVNSLGFSDRLVFDELLVLMTNEIDAALEWISTRTCMTNWTYFEDLEVQDDMNACTLPPELSFTSTDTGSLWLANTTTAPAPTSAVVLARSSSSHPAALPPERGSRNMLWDAIIEGPAFAHVIKFLDSLGNLGTMFDRLCGPPGDGLGGRQQLSRLNAPPLRSFNELILNLIIGRIWKNANFNWVAHIMRAAINMVGIGAIETLRDFENYVVGISKFCEELPKRLHFLKAFVGICGRFAPAFDHRQVRAGQAPYSDDYVESRCRELQGETRLRPAFTRPHTTAADSITQHLINGLNVQPWDMSQNWVAEGQLFQGPAFQENCQDLSSSWRVPNAPVDYFQAGAMAKGATYHEDDEDDEHEYEDSEDMMDYSQLQPQVVPDNYPFNFASAANNIHIRQGGHARTPSTGTANSPGTPKSNHSGKSASGHRSSPSWSMSDRSTPIRRAPRRNRPAEGREFTCDVPGCGARIRGSKYTRSNSNLLRHKRSAHPTMTEAMQEYWCEEVGCTARYTGARARENLKTHMKNKHGKVTPKKTARRTE